MVLLVERRTGTPLRQVRFLGATRDSPPPPRVTIQCRLSSGVRSPRSGLFYESDMCLQFFVWFATVCVSPVTWKRTTTGKTGGGGANKIPGNKRIQSNLEDKVVCSSKRQHQTKKNYTEKQILILLDRVYQGRPQNPAVQNLRISIRHIAHPSQNVFSVVVTRWELQPGPAVEGIQTFISGCLPRIFHIC